MVRVRVRVRVRVKVRIRVRVRVRVRDRASPNPSPNLGVEEGEPARVRAVVPRDRTAATWLGARVRLGSRARVRASC